MISNWELEHDPITFGQIRTQIYPFTWPKIKYISALNT